MDARLGPRETVWLVWQDNRAVRVYGTEEEARAYAEAAWLPTSETSVTPHPMLGSRATGPTTHKEAVMEKEERATSGATIDWGRKSRTTRVCGMAGCDAPPAAYLKVMVQARTEVQGRSGGPGAVLASKQRSLCKAHAEEGFAALIAALEGLDDAC